MNSKDINRAVSAMNEAAVRATLSRLAALDLEITRKPETGLVMMNVPDCFSTEFHLGEVLVTVAEVEYAGDHGWGMIMGDEAEKALLLASIDALFKTGDSPTAGQLTEELRTWLNQAEAKINDELKRAAATRVNFESMAVD